MRVVVGQNTIVKKITVGTPLRVGSAANGSLTGLDDVNGSVNLSDGTILQYDSASGKFLHVSPATITGSGLTVQDSGGLGSLAYDSNLAVLTYNGPSSDSIHSLFNATYDSSALGTLSYTDGTVRLTGPTAAQIRALFSAGNSLNYNETTGEFSVTVPETSASFDSDFGTKTTDDLAEGSTNLYYTDSRGRAALSVTDAGGFGSLAYNSATGEITYTGPSVAETRSVINVGDNLGYDSATGKITFTGTLAGEYTDSDAQAALSVISSGDYASLSYANGVFTFTGIGDSDIRGSLTAAGDLSYNAATGEFSFTQRTDAEVRGLFSAGSGITYDSATGKISTNVGVHYEDSDARNAISVIDNGGQGSLSYDNNTGEITYQGSSDSDIRGLISASGDITYNQNTGVISFTERTDAEIRGLFNVSGDLGYDTATGVFSVDLGSVDVTDSSVTRALFSVTNDDGDYGSLSYDAGTGTFNFTKVTDSDIRGSLSAQNTGNAEGFGELSFDSGKGQFSFNRIQPFEIRSVFSGAGDIQYDSGTGKFSLTVGAHYEDSDARNVFSVNFIGDTARDSSPYGDATYDPSTGELTIYGTSDSNIRGSFTVQDSGGLGSLTYIEKQGRIVYRGPDVSDVAGLLSATQDSLSMGTLTLDSSTGQFTLKLEDDSVRSLFSVVSDDEGGTSLRYDQASGVFTYTGPSTLNLRSQLSVRESDNTGDGSLTYDESTGVFSFVGPSPAEVRAHFAGGLGIDYIENTGTFRLDSSANIVTASIVTGELTATDDATFDKNVTINSDLTVTNITGGDSFQDLTLTGNLLLKGNRVLIDTPFFHSTDNRIVFSVDDSNLDNLDGGGFVLGGGDNIKLFLYNKTNDKFELNTGLDVAGELSGPTIDSINKRIDELPDSAQMKGILSAGPGLSYDNVNGIYRIISSGVTAGTYGSVTEVPQITVDSLGIVTNLSNVAISTVDDFVFDSTSGNLKIVTATDSFNVGITLDPYSTTNLVEGDNLYYTTARADSDARAALSAGRGINYNESTGTFRIDSDHAITVGSVTATNANLDYVDLETSAQPGWTEGRIFYDSDTKSVSYYNDKNDVTINMGQEFVVRIYNDTASPLYNGRAVHFNGRMGDTPTVRLSQGDDKSIARVDGVLTSTIQPGGFGYVTRLGFVNGINTNGLTEGAELYLATDSLGGFTTTEPDAELYFPFHVGRVIVEDSTQGRILVDPWTEFYEHLRVTDHLHVDSEAHIPIVMSDRIAFNTTQFTDINVPENLPTFREGNLFYFQGPDALTYSNEKINIKIGQDEVFRVYNNTGSTIAKGKAVYVTGAVNDFPTIALAKADTFETIYTTAGLTSNEIAAGEYGYVTVRGLYGGLNTAAFSPGDIVHVSPDSAGELVAYSPTYPNYAYQMGTVLVADSATGGNVGGCIQVTLQAEVFENIRTQGNSRIGGDLTVVGDLNILGSENVTTVANLAVTDNFVYLGAGDTVTAQALDSGLNDLSFVGHYEGENIVSYFVKISATDPAGDTIVWSFDSDFATLEGFDSAGGPTSYDISGTLPVKLRYGISVDFEAITGHDSGERWQGDAAPVNQQLGIIGNYNTATDPYAHTGVFRDNADGRFKFFNGYQPEIEGSVNTADSSYEDADIQFGTGYGDIVGNVTGNVTGQVSDLSNLNTSNLPEDPDATDSSGTQYFTSARARSSIFATDAGGDGSFTYDSATGEMVYTGPSEAEFYQHFKDNADSWGDLIFDSAYGNAGGGFKLHERHILRHEEVFSDSWVNTAEYFLVYSGTTGGLKKVRGDTLASTLGGGGGGAGGGLFGYINM